MQAETLGAIQLDTDDSVTAARARMQALLRAANVPADRVDFLAVGFATWCRDMRLRGAKRLQLSYLNRSGGASVLVDAKLSPQALTTPYAGSPFFEHFLQADGNLRIFVVLSDRQVGPSLIDLLREQMAYKTRDQLFIELESHKLHLEDEVATQTAALRASEAQMRALLEGSPVAVRVAAVDDGRLMFVNSSFADLYRVSRPALLAGGMQAMAVQSNEGADLLDALRAGNDVLNCPVTLHNPAGELVHVVASYMHVVYDNAPAVLTWMFDVTDLRRAKDLAEEATRARTDFLSNISHEIRTPLNAIIGMSHLALQSALTAQQHTYVSKISKAGKSLLGIVTDILDFSKVENGQIALASLPFKLDEVLAALCDEQSARASEKGLSYTQLVQAGVPLDLTGDAQRLGQVFAHVVGNAIKFTARGSVKVELTCLQRAGTRVQLQCRVTDTGVGLTSAQQHKLFQPFSQGDSSSTRQFGGTGLGLVICMQLLALMDGRIWVDSAPDVGSSFVFDAWFDCVPDARVQPQTVLAQDLPLPLPLSLSLSTAISTPDATAKSDWAAMRHTLTRLRALLDDNDADALDLLAEISAAGAPPRVQSQMQVLARQVSEFNFKDALTALDEMERLMA